MHSAPLPLFDPSVCLTNIWFFWKNPDYISGMVKEWWSLENTSLVSFPTINMGVNFNGYEPWQPFSVRQKSTSTKTVLLPVWDKKREGTFRSHCSPPGGLGTIKSYPFWFSCGGLLLIKKSCFATASQEAKHSGPFVGSATVCTRWRARILQPPDERLV